MAHGDARYGSTLWGDRETSESDSEGSESAKVLDEGDTEQKEEETIETLKGNEI